MLPRSKAVTHLRSKDTTALLFLLCERAHARALFEQDGYSRTSSSMAAASVRCIAASSRGLSSSLSPTSTIIHRPVVSSLSSSTMEWSSETGASAATAVAKAVRPNESWENISSMDWRVGSYAIYV